MPVVSLISDFAIVDAFQSRVLSKSVAPKLLGSDLTRANAPPMRFQRLDRNGNFDQFNEIITSCSDSLEEYPPMGRSEPSLDVFDRLMKVEGGDMVLFGRWRHRKDTPLSLVELQSDSGISLQNPACQNLYDSSFNTSFGFFAVVSCPQEQSCDDASGAGVVQLTKTLATERARHQIRVNSISGAIVDLRMIGWACACAIYCVVVDFRRRAGFEL